MKRTLPLFAAAFFFFSAPAFAQDENPPPASTASPSAAKPSSEESKEEKDTKARFALGIERFGGIAYGKGVAKDSDDSVSVLTMGIGVGTVNPFAVPRLGVDYILDNGISLGGGVGFARWSGSSANGSRSEDIGSIFLYTLTPRVGYRVPISKSVDVIPRVGLTLAGASISEGSGNSSQSIFAVGLGLEAPFACRITDSFHILVAPAFDVTLAATASSTQTSGGTTTSSSDDLKATVWALQGWVGVGGYL